MRAGAKRKRWHARSARVIAERKAAGGEVGLAVARGVEALRLDRRVRNCFD
jgi:hypothetical protein